MEDWNLLEQITGALLSWGAGTALASVVAHLLALLILVAVACVADVVCRHIVLKAVAKVVRHTKAKWDDVNNYIATSPLILDGKPLDKIPYDSAQGGRRPEGARTGGSECTGF